MFENGTEGEFSDNNIMMPDYRQADLIKRDSLLSITWLP